MSTDEIKHLSGEGVVVRHWYATADGHADVHTSLPDEAERDLWQDAAFTNGPALVKIEIVWAPGEVRKLSEQASSSENS